MNQIRGVFVGKIEMDEFEVSRPSRYRNAFCPVFNGSLIVKDEGTTIEVTATPPALAFALSYVLVVVGLIVFLTNLFSSSRSWDVIVPDLVYLIFVIFIPSAGFSSEVDLSWQSLKSILSSEQ